MLNSLRIYLPVVFLGMLIAGCSRSSNGPYSSSQQSDAVRDPAASAALFERAKPDLVTDPKKAEELLRQALDKDLYNGAAHNNLGVLLMGKGDLYEAAREFEWARKLLPGHPDPRVNLAIALEAAQKPRDAIDAARAALEVQPGHLPAIQALAFIQVRSDLTDEKTGTLLATIIERSQDQEWRDWAMTSKARWESRAQKGVE